MILQLAKIAGPLSLLSRVVQHVYDYVCVLLLAVRVCLDHTLSHPCWQVDLPSGCKPSTPAFVEIVHVWEWDPTHTIPKANPRTLRVFIYKSTNHQMTGPPRFVAVGTT